MAGSNMGQVRPGAGPGGSGRHMDPDFAAYQAMPAQGSRGKIPPIQDNRVVLHVDVNAAFLSWEATYRRQHGEGVDLRDIPSVIAGDESLRKGIVLACSLPAKRYGVHTGETLWQARRKCPSLLVAPPAQPLYQACSEALTDLLCGYTDKVARYSIDECFLDLTDAACLMDRNPEAVAIEIRDRVRQELGFTVNIGVSVNKLLAKTASELEKPNRVHTLYPAEIPQKFWTLPVRELFLVGPRVAPRLYRLNIFSIGHLAQADPELLERHLGSLGPLLWQFANGHDNTPVLAESTPPKAIGNSASTPYNVDTEREALLYLHAVAETAACRLRAAGMRAQVVTVGYRTANLAYATRQGRLSFPTDHTATLISQADRLFRSRWDGTPVRHVGISFSELSAAACEQLSLFPDTPVPKGRQLDQCVDTLRQQYGTQAAVRAEFIASGIPPMAGGPQGDSSGIPPMTGTLHPAASTHTTGQADKPAHSPSKAKPGLLYGPWAGVDARQGRDHT